MYIVIILLAASVSRWNVEDMRSWMLASSNSSRQNRLVKTGSRSLTMELGMLCTRTIMSKKTQTTNVVV
jgi:hypothetical protein